MYSEPALEATREDVEIRRRQAESRPDVDLPRLAMIQNRLAKALSDLGRREEALEATRETIETLLTDRTCRRRSSSRRGQSSRGVPAGSEVDVPCNSES